MLRASGPGHPATWPATEARTSCCSVRRVEASWLCPAPGASPAFAASTQSAATELGRRCADVMMSVLVRQILMKVAQSTTEMGERSARTQQSERKLCDSL